MHFRILGLSLCFILMQPGFANELVSYDHNLFVTRPIVPKKVSNASTKEDIQQWQLQKRSLHAQKFINHDNKPYMLGYHEAREQKMQEHIRKTARDRG